MALRSFGSVWWCLITLALVITMATPAAHAQGGGSPKTLRVCEDPNYLPFSNRAGQGFENKVAEAVGRDLGMRVTYYWMSQRSEGGYDQFLQDTLRAHRCDVLMDVPYASQDVAATEPYYISSYVFVYKRNKGYDIDSMDSPALRHVKIGFEEDTPAAMGLKMRALTIGAVDFDTSDNGDASPAQMLDAIDSGRINVAVTWEPAIGMFLLKRHGLTVIPVPNSRSQGAPEQYIFPMSMAVRPGDSRLRQRLNAVIASHKPELQRILAANGVRLYRPGVDASGSM